MKLSAKLKKAKELEEEVKAIQHSADERARKKWKPLEQKAQKLKDSVYKSAKGLVKLIEDDMKKFVKNMQKKYGDLKELNIESNVSYFGNSAEVAVDFEISLEDIIKYEEKLKKPKPPKGRITKENEMPKKFKETLREKAKRLANKRKEKK